MRDKKKTQRTECHGLGVSGQHFFCSLSFRVIFALHLISRLFRCIEWHREQCIYSIFPETAICSFFKNYFSFFTFIFVKEMGVLLCFPGWSMVTIHRRDLTNDQHGSLTCCIFSNFRFLTFFLNRHLKR